MELNFVTIIGQQVLVINKKKVQNFAFAFINSTNFNYSHPKQFYQLFLHFFIH